jgi:hypothetical protein
MSSLHTLEKYHPALRCAYQVLSDEGERIYRIYYPNLFYRITRIVLPIIIPIFLSLMRLETRFEKSNEWFPITVACYLMSLFSVYPYIIVEDPRITPEKFHAIIETNAKKGGLSDLQIFESLKNRMLNSAMKDMFQNAFKYEKYYFYMSIILLTTTIGINLKNQYKFKSSISSYAFLVGFLSSGLFICSMVLSHDVTQNFSEIKACDSLR